MALRTKKVKKSSSKVWQTLIFAEKQKSDRIKFYFQTPPPVFDAKKNLLLFEIFIFQQTIKTNQKFELKQSEEKKVVH